MSKLLCFFGFHNWGFSYINGWVVSKKCSTCDKEVIYYKD